MPKVTYRDVLGGEVAGVHAGSTLLEAALGAGLDHFHQCNGLGRCTTCRVRVLEGESELTPPTPQETLIAREKRWPPEIRLACQARVHGDIEIAREVLELAAIHAMYREIEEPPPAEERNLAVLFCDLRNFTGFAANHLPHDVVYVLNLFFREACDPILECGGFIDKYLGDGFLAVFGLEETDPESICRNALRTGLRILPRVRHINSSLAASFGTELSFGIGIHYGPAVIGQAGHPLKMQLTVLGDTVNIAHRIESATRLFGENVLVSETVRDILADDLRADLPLFDAPVKAPATTFPARAVGPDDFFDGAYLVQSDFDGLLGHTHLCSQGFYDTVFERAPELRQIFAKADMGALNRQFMEMLAAAVRHAHRLGELCPVLRDLGARHVSYGVLPGHYPVAGEALLDTLAKHVGERFGELTRPAWENFVGAIFGAMLEGAEAAPEAGSQ